MAIGNRVQNKAQAYENSVYAYTTITLTIYVCVPAFVQLIEKWQCGKQAEKRANSFWTSGALHSRGMLVCLVRCHKPQKASPISVVCIITQPLSSISVISHLFLLSQSHYHSRPVTSCHFIFSSWFGYIGFYPDFILNGIRKFHPHVVSTVSSMSKSSFDFLSYKEQMSMDLFWIILHMVVRDLQRAPTQTHHHQHSWYQQVKVASQ